MKEYLKKSQRFVALVLSVLISFTMMPNVFALNTGVAGDRDPDRETVKAGYTLKGVVKDSAGKVVSGASVKLTGGTKAKTVKTTTKGAYTFTGVAKGTSYVLTATKAGFEETKTSKFSVTKATTKNITLKAIGYDVTVIVKNEDGKAVKNAEVTLKSTAATLTGKTNAYGKVVLAKASKGYYTGTVKATGYEDAKIDRFNVTKAVTKNVELTKEVTAATVTGLAITTAPTKVTYEVGEKLDLTGLSVTLTMSDDKTEVVPFASFVDKGIETAPANGATLAVTDTKVAVTHKTSTKSADQAITVAAAPVVVDITGITLGTIAAPVTAAVPQATYTASEATANYTGAIVWAPADAAFAAGTEYKATLTLTAKTGFKFKTGFAAADVTGLPATGVVVPSTDNGATVKIEITYPKTVATVAITEVNVLTATSIRVKINPPTTGLTAANNFELNTTDATPVKLNVVSATAVDATGSAYNLSVAAMSNAKEYKLTFKKLGQPDSFSNAFTYYGQIPTSSVVTSDATTLVVTLATANSTKLTVADISKFVVQFTPTSATTAELYTPTALNHIAGSTLVELTIPSLANKAGKINVNGKDGSVDFISPTAVLAIEEGVAKTSFAVTFDEALNATTLAKTAVSDVITALTYGGAALTPSSITWAGNNTLTVTIPATDFVSGKALSITLKADVVLDVAGNKLLDLTINASSVTTNDIAVSLTVPAVGPTLTQNSTARTISIGTVAYDKRGTIVLSVTKEQLQTMSVTGTDASKVTLGAITNSNKNQVVTVDGTAVSTDGGTIKFNLVATEDSKVARTYAVTITVAAAAETADVTVVLTTPTDDNAGNDIVTTGRSIAVKIDRANQAAGVTLTVTKGTAQRLAISGTDASKVTKSTPENLNAQQLVIAGLSSPIAGGTYSFRVTVSDANGNDKPIDYNVTLTVSPEKSIAAHAYAVAAIDSVSTTASSIGVDANKTKITARVSSGTPVDFTAATLPNFGDIADIISKLGATDEITFAANGTITQIEIKAGTYLLPNTTLVPKNTTLNVGEGALVKSIVLPDNEGLKIQGVLNIKSGGSLTAAGTTQGQIVVSGEGRLNVASGAVLLLGDSTEIDIYGPNAYVDLAAGTIENNNNVNGAAVGDIFVLDGGNYTYAGEKITGSSDALFSVKVHEATGTEDDNMLMISYATDIPNRIYTVYKGEVTLNKDLTLPLGKLLMLKQTGILTIAPNATLTASRTGSGILTEGKCAIMVEGTLNVTNLGSSTGIYYTAGGTSCDIGIKPTGTVTINNAAGNASYSNLSGFSGDLWATAGAKFQLGAAKIAGGSDALFTPTGDYMLHVVLKSQDKQYDVRLADNTKTSPTGGATLNKNLDLVTDTKKMELNDGATLTIGVGVTLTANGTYTLQGMKTNDKIVGMSATSTIILGGASAITGAMQGTTANNASHNFYAIGGTAAVPVGKEVAGQKTYTWSTNADGSGSSVLGWKAGS